MVALTTLMHERETLSFSIIVMFEQRLRALIERSRRSTLHGAPALKDAQARQRLARLYTDVKTFKLNTMRQMATVGQGRLPGPEGSLLKLQWSELNQRLVELAFELEGPYSSLAPTRSRRHLRAAGSMNTCGRAAIRLKRAPARCSVISSLSACLDCRAKEREPCI